ncbi:MAG TPA: DUF2325 domain-containing protein [Burkholderiaceae bacterium]
MDLTPPPSPPLHQGSRRRRLWELDGHAHCPVIGVCLPIAALRNVVDKVLAGHALASDYELHCGAIAECKRRSAIAEGIQRELDRRCAVALRQAAAAKTEDALAAWWEDQAGTGHDLAGALWATLTHARCTPALETRVLGDVHMLQHQIGVAQRVDVRRFDALAAANDALTRELADAQRRGMRAAAEQAQRNEAQQADIVTLRAEVIARDTVIAQLRGELHEAAARTSPGQAERDARRIEALERALQRAQFEIERERRRADELGTALAAARAAGRTPLPATDDTTGAVEDAATDGPSAPTLTERSVLCVGGRPASVPIYRDLIERTGGRFLHHDGGDEDGTAKLDATLAAADLVICQAGCISHGAYWRVKDHCKRTGKRCVFVESPSASGLKRALAALQPEAGAHQPENA